MKKQIAVILCFAMLISVIFSGCGAATIVGSWKGTVDMTEMLNEYVTAGDESMAEYFNFSDIKLDVTMTFNEDGTYAVAFDEASIENMMENLIDQLVPGMTAMMEDLAGMSLEDLLEMSGTTEEEWIDEMTAEFSAGMDMSELNTEANYKVEDGMLYMSDDLDDEIDEDTTGNPYTLEGDTLTIEAGDADDEVAFMFPLVLKKIG